MDYIKSIIMFIDSVARCINLDFFYGLTIYYLAVTAALFLIMIFRGVGK